jgi:MoxR-like ATPase
MRTPREWSEAVAANVARVLVEVDRPLRLVLAALLADGHVLFEDVPGVGKTRLAQAVARSIGGDFRRIQFTPDVLPSDVTGTHVFDPRDASFRFRPGPVFTHILLADEINRATPRTQSSLLEAMEERQVTVDGETRRLPAPFLVLATQNPVELEGTFPLPEAQLDRFLLRVAVGYPSEAGEREMLLRLGRGAGAEDLLSDLAPVSDLAEAAALARTVRSVRVEPEVAGYLVSLGRASRSHPTLRLGASPRALGGWFRAAQAWAALDGRDFVRPDDVKALAEPVLAHRLILGTEAELRGEDAAAVVAELVESVPAPVEPR